MAREDARLLRPAQEEDIHAGDPPYAQRSLAKPPARGDGGATGSSAWQPSGQRHTLREPPITPSAPAVLSGGGTITEPRER
jgi:hypothetical protein